MADYFVSDDVYRIYLADHDGSDHYVDIKDELTDKDQRALAMALAARGAEFEQLPDGTVRVSGTADMDAYADVLLERCVRSWSLVSKGGAPVPVTPRTIAQLRGGVSTFIMLRAQDHYNAQRLSEAEAKNLSGPPSPASSTVAPSPQNSADSPSANGSASTPTRPSAPALFSSPASS